MPKSPARSVDYDFSDGVIVRYHVKASFVIDLALDKPLRDLTRALAENLDNQIEAAGGIESFIDSANLMSVSDCQDRLLADTLAEANADPQVKAESNMVEAAEDMFEALQACLRLIEGENLDEAHGEVADLVRDALDRAQGLQGED